MSISSKIDALPGLRQTVEENNLWANKAFGQNFLFDLNVTAKIARAAGDLSQTAVFEIGPGPGGLTRAILARTDVKRLIAIEMDPRFITALQPLVDAAEGRFELVHGDALKTDILSLSDAPRAVMANLPYNIGTELLIGWLQNASQFSQFILMFQKEVADRLVAKPDTKAYGRLSVLAQSLCHVDIVMKLPPSAFTPAPKVTSSVARLIPREDAASIPVKALEIITAAAFGQRRKMLRQSLKAYADIMEVNGIDPQRRAETLSVQEFLALAKTLDERIKSK